MSGNVTPKKIWDAARDNILQPAYLSQNISISDKDFMTENMKHAMTWT